MIDESPSFLAALFPGRTGKQFHPCVRGGFAVARRPRLEDLRGGGDQNFYFPENFYFPDK